MQHKYKIEYEGKTYRQLAHSCDAAMNKFCNRKVFGTPLCENAVVKQYDARTRGQEWAQYRTGYADKYTMAMVHRVF